MKQEFALNLADASYDRDKLKTLMDSIDSEKRSIKSHLSQLSSESSKHPNGLSRQKMIRQAKDKISFLTEEREIVRNKIAEVKKLTATACKSSNMKKIGFADNFYAAAQEKLPSDLFAEIEHLAAQLTSKD